MRLPLRKFQQEKSFLSDTNINFLEKKGMNIINYYNFNYFGVIQLGSTGKELRVILDTGSNILWVRDSNKFGSGYNSFSCSKSMTCRPDLGFTKTITYGKGKISGYKVVEQLKLGSLTLPSYNMLLAQQVSDIPANIDGILGLSLTSGYDTGFPTVIEKLKSSGLIGTQTFSMFLGDKPTAKGDVTGEIIFGGYDPKYAIGDFKFVKVKNKLHWETTLHEVSLGADIKVCTKALNVIFDSGTSLLLLPQDVLKNIVNHLNSKGANCRYVGGEISYKCSCSAVSSLPDLIFHFDGNSFNIPASAYLVRMSYDCELLIQETIKPPPGYVDETQGILGDVFLKNYYALYTAENRTVGLAPVDNKAGINGNSGYMDQELKMFLIFFAVMTVVGICMYYRHHNREKRTREVQPLDLVFEGTQKSRLIREYEEQATTNPQL